MSTINIQPGVLNLPGSTPASKAATEKYLTKDHEAHHCYFSPVGLHNHLNHHLLAAYDLGASDALIESIYNEEAKGQRDILLDNDSSMPKPGAVNEENWKKFLGDQKSYAAYLTFFTSQAKALGANGVVERYIFGESANSDGAEMSGRFLSGAFHPFIQLGYAAEFGNDTHLIAAALAQTAIHAHHSTLGVIRKHTPPASDSDKGSLFHVLAEYYKSDALEPVLPYDPNALLSKRRDAALLPPSKRAEELARVISLWDISPSPGSKEAHECLWAAALLFASSGRKGFKPRLDFFLMHGLTSSLFIPSLLKMLSKDEYKIELLRGWLAALSNIILIRGRPRLDANLVMSFTEVPLLPAALNVLPGGSSSAIGANQASINPWLFIIQSALRAPDSHTIKAIRSLLYGSHKLGTTPAGQIPGALDLKGNELLPGLKSADGTVFIRAAGVVMRTLGWVDWGETEGGWDGSGLGWDDAWKDEKAVNGKM